MRDVTDLLDQLEAAREKATPGIWQVMNGDTIATQAEQTGRGSFTWEGHIVLRMDDWRDDSDQQPNEVPVEDDAACIVAEHNATPQLVAALRAAWDVADFVDEAARGRGTSVAAAYQDIADRLRNALTAALTATTGETA